MASIGTPKKSPHTDVTGMPIIQPDWPVNDDVPGTKTTIKKGYTPPIGIPSNGDVSEEKEELPSLLAPAMFIGAALLSWELLT